MRFNKFQPLVKNLRLFFEDVSIAQIVAGALAAVTAAFILSHVGVAGTLIGTAVGSIIGSTGTAFYRNSIINSHKAVQKVTQIRLASVNGNPVDDDNNTASTAAIPETPNETTAEIPVILEPINDGTPIVVSSNTVEDGEESTLQQPSSKINWKVIAVSTLISLLVAIVVLLSIERITQEPIISTNTITRIVQTPAPTVTPSPSPTTIIIVPEETDEPTDTSTDEPTTAPTAEPTVAPTTEPTIEPVPAPTTTAPAPAPTATPEPTVEPTTPIEEEPATDPTVADPAVANPATTGTTTGTTSNKTGATDSGYGY